MVTCLRQARESSILHGIIGLFHKPWLGQATVDEVMGHAVLVQCSNVASICIRTWGRDWSRLLTACICVYIYAYKYSLVAPAYSCATHHKPVHHGICRTPSPSSSGKLAECSHSLRGGFISVFTRPLCLISTGRINWDTIQYKVFCFTR